MQAGGFRRRRQPATELQAAPDGFDSLRFVGEIGCSSRPEFGAPTKPCWPAPGTSVAAASSPCHRPSGTTASVVATHSPNWQVSGGSRGPLLRGAVRSPAGSVGYVCLTPGLRLPGTPPGPGFHEARGGADDVERYWILLACDQCGRQLHCVGASRGIGPHRGRVETRPRPCAAISTQVAANDRSRSSLRPNSTESINSSRWSRFGAEAHSTCLLHLDQQRHQG